MPGLKYDNFTGICRQWHIYRLDICTKSYYNPLPGTISYHNAAHGTNFPNSCLLIPAWNLGLLTLISHLSLQEAQNAYLPFNSNETV